jgi:putative PIN family toxin of toxin-antitoxin system
MRVVIDTNVIVSAYLSPAGVSAKLMVHLEQEAFVLLVSEPILAEYQRALDYQKVSSLHGMSSGEVADLIDDMRAAAIVVDPIETLDVVKQDPDDNKFFECAVAGGATYIVSVAADVQAVGIFRGIGVVSPALFLEILAQGIA